MAAPALAVSTSYWTQTTEADFKAGTLENVVATNLGELKLSRAVNTLLEQDPRVSTVNRLIEGTATARSMPAPDPMPLFFRSKIARFRRPWQIPDATDILSLAIDPAGALLIGTGGEKGKILRVDKAGDKPKEISAPDGAAIYLGASGNFRRQHLRRHRP